jgi:hypothetical protein
MNEQPVAYGHPATLTHASHAPIRWLARIVARLLSLRRERHRCVDVSARAMHDSSLGG